jgi:hypothetical protein
MDSSLIKEQAMRCRSLAENADQFPKRRLLDLAAKYEDRLGRASLASRALGIPAQMQPPGRPRPIRLTVTSARGGDVRT